MLEHYSFTVRFICDRGTSHEIVRHRIASYSQESQRYCSYDKEQFSSEITVVAPDYPIGYDAKTLMYRACGNAEEAYLSLLAEGCKPEDARAVLPTNTKTEIIMTANIREWRHFLRLRTSSAAHPQIRILATGLLNELQERVPILFDDITPNT